MIDFIDKTTGQDGTLINRENLMAIQGMENNSVNIVEDTDGSIEITETNNDGHIMTVTIAYATDGTATITERFVGDKTITKITTVNAEGTQISGRIQE